MKIYLCSQKNYFAVSNDTSRAEIRHFFSSQAKEVKKSPNSINTMDVFPDLGIHCFYDKENKLLAMEIFSPNKFSIEEQNYLNWIGKTNDEIINYLKKINFISLNNIEVDDLGIKLLNYPISTVVNEKQETECCYLDFSDSKTSFYISKQA